MYHWQKIDRHFLVLLSSACLVLSPSLNAKAQQMTIAEQPHTNTPVAQTQTPTNQTPRPRRPKTAFFEDERRQFGFGDFLSSALDGNDNTLSADPVKVSAGIPRTNPSQQGSAGTLTVLSRDPDDTDFVNITFVDLGTNTYFSLAVTEDNRSADPRIGSVQIGGTVQISSQNLSNLPADIRADIPANGILPLNPNTNQVIITNEAFSLVNTTEIRNGQPTQVPQLQATINNLPITIPVDRVIPATLNGLPITSNVRVYNVGASYSGSPVSGVVLITNPDDPSTSIYIQLPPTAIPDTDDNLPVSGAAFLSIGRPTDR